MYAGGVSNIRELSLGPEHPDVGYTLNGLVNLYKEQGKYAEVEALYKRALRIRELSLGPEHSLTPVSYTHLTLPTILRV